MRKFDEWETRHLIRALEIAQVELDREAKNFEHEKRAIAASADSLVPDWLVHDDARNKQLLKTFKLSLKKKLEWNNMVKEWME